MKAVEWIDRLKAARGWETDYRVAKELAVAHSALSRYRSKPESTMDDVVATKVAEALDLEPKIVIIDQIAERTPIESVRSEFRALLARLTKRKGPRVGGGGQVDITSAASTAPGGDPANATHTGLARNTHRIVSVSLLRRALASLAPSGAAPAPACA